jgi:hypothetical protein
MVQLAVQAAQLGKSYRVEEHDPIFFDRLGVEPGWSRSSRNAAAVGREPNPAAIEDPESTD